MSAVIGIPTFKRQSSLRRLLASVASDVPPDVHICVVDNDPLRSAESIVTGHTGHRSIAYLAESRPGVVHVRNRLVAHARTLQVDALIFLDDDQWVLPGWYSAMLNAHKAYPRDIVTGPVRYQLPDTARANVRNGGFFARPEHPHLAQIPMTGTGNTLIPLAVLASLGEFPFNPRLSLVGGEDTDLILRAQRNGALVRWVADAVAYEEVAESEANLAGIASRYRRSGYVLATLASDRQPRVRVIAGGVARFAFGLAKYARGRIQGGDMRSRDLASLHAGIGYLRAALGIPLTAYGSDEDNS